jgi:hypothetical protein
MAKRLTALSREKKSEEVTSVTPVWAKDIGRIA